MIKEMFFFLSRCYFLLLFNVQGEDVDNSCPQNFFHNVTYIWFRHQDLRRWVSIGKQPRYFIFSLAIALG